MHFEIDSLIGKCNQRGAELIGNALGSHFAYLSSRGIKCSSIKVLHDQRNEVIRVHTEGGRELLLKRGSKRLTSGDGSLLNEGLTYQLLSELKIGDLAPRCILHDRECDVLIMDYVNGKTARQCWNSIGTDQQVWGSLGTALAQVHVKGASAPEWPKRILGDFEELVPSAQPLQPADIIAASSGELQIIRIIQSDPLIGSRLNELASTTMPTLIHGDVRLDNILFDDKGKVRFIDFELSRIGDPLFDLGTLLGSVFEHVAISGEGEDNESASQLINRAATDSFVQLRAIIAGYRAAARSGFRDLMEPEDFLARLSGFVGVHLLHRAGALANEFYVETRMARLLTIIGCAFIRNPSHLLRPLNLDASHNWIRRNRRISE